MPTRPIALLLGGMLFISLPSIAFITADDSAVTLSGKWELESYESSDGEFGISDDHDAFTELEFPVNERDVYFLKTKLGTYCYRFKLSPDKEPKEIDIWLLGTKEKRKPASEEPTFRGIYKVEKGRLIRCVSESKFPRPTKFDADSADVFITTHRKKEGSAAP